MNIHWRVLARFSNLSWRGKLLFGAAGGILLRKEDSLEICLANDLIFKLMSMRNV